MSKIVEFSLSSTIARVNFEMCQTLLAPMSLCALAFCGNHERSEQLGSPSNHLAPSGEPRSRLQQRLFSYGLSFPGSSINHHISFLYLIVGNVLAMY